MVSKGNYWLELMEKERSIRKEIESVVKKLIGRRFSDYSDLSSKIKEVVRVQLENYGVLHHMGIFNLEYDLDLKYDNKFVFTGFEVRFVLLDENVW